MLVYALGATLALIIGLVAGRLARSYEFAEGLHSASRVQHYLEALYYSVPAAAIIGGMTALLQPVKKRAANILRFIAASVWTIVSFVMFADGFSRFGVDRAPIAYPVLILIVLFSCATTSFYGRGCSYRRRRQFSAW